MLAGATVSPDGMEREMGKRPRRNHGAEFKARVEAAHLYLGTQAQDSGETGENPDAPRPAAKRDLSQFICDSAPTKYLMPLEEQEGLL
jgi:hypothetical protein